MYCRVFRGMGNITANGGSQYPGGSGTGGGGAGGRVAIYFNVNNTYLGSYQSHGGDVFNTGSHVQASVGGPGTIFLYHQEYQHRTLYVNNDGLQTKQDAYIHDYNDISKDTFKAWIFPDAGKHWLALGNFDFRFEELQIYGNAHLAILPEPVSDGANIHFKNMIGDRTGVVHIGPQQVMDLRRPFLDTPFSTYIYHHGYFGMAPDTNLEKVFVHAEGTFDHVINMTLIAGGELRLHLTGSTNSRAAREYHINGSTIIKADSSINCSSPRSHPDAYNLVFKFLQIEGGGAIRGTYMQIAADDFNIDDGGEVDVSNGGSSPDTGTSKFLYGHKMFYFDQYTMY